MEKKSQFDLMRWIVFYMSIALFIVVFVLTILTLFFELFEIPEKYMDSLFKLFIGETGLFVIALFYSLFGLNRAETREFRLEFETGTDPMEMVGKKAEIAYYRNKNSRISGKTVEVQNIQGPAVLLAIPRGTKYLSLEIRNESVFSGTVNLDNMSVKMVQETI